MLLTFEGDIIDLIKLSNLISDRLYDFGQTFPDFKYRIRLKIDKNISTLIICTTSTVNYNQKLLI
jgi:hypothetical protein